MCRKLTYVPKEAREKLTGEEMFCYCLFKRMSNEWYRGQGFDRRRAAGGPAA